MKKFVCLLLVAVMFFSPCMVSGVIAMGETGVGGDGDGGASVDWQDDSLEPFIGVWKLTEGYKKDDGREYPMDAGVLWIDYADSKENTIDLTSSARFHSSYNGSVYASWNITKPKHKFTAPWTIAWTSAEGIRASIRPSNSDTKSEYKLEYDADNDILILTVTTDSNLTTVKYERRYPDRDRSTPLGGTWKMVEGSTNYITNGGTLSGIPFKYGRIVILDEDGVIMIGGTLYYDRSKNAWLLRNLRYAGQHSSADSPTRVRWSLEDSFIEDGKPTPLRSSHTLELQDDGTLSVAISSSNGKSTAVFERDN